MTKRDLKSDLAKLEHMDELFPEPSGNFVRDVIVKEALRRAIAAEEEVERLKEENRGLIENQKEVNKKNIRLMLQIQDALNTLEWYSNYEYYSFGTFDSEPPEILQDRGKSAQQAIQRIQGDKGEVTHV